MLLVLFGFWLLMNGRWTTEIAVTGAVVSVLLYVFVCVFMDYSPRREWAVARRAWKAARYLVFLGGEVCRSAMTTIRLIWSPRLVVQPEVTSFRTRLRTNAGKVLLSNSITLTPGTITVDVQDDLVLVHCLDESMAEGLEGSEMERRLLALEGGKAHE